MNCAFVCWRPFQIFNSVNFIYHNYENTKGNSDIYILNISDNIKCLNGLNKSGLFKNIYLFKKGYNRNPLKTRIQLFKDHIVPRKAIKRDLLDKKNVKFDNYDILIGSGYLGFFLYLIEVNKNARIILLEDGIISYQGDERVLRQETWMNIILNKVFHKGDLSISVESLYLNNIDFKANSYPYLIKPMPILDQQTIKLLKQVFDCEEINTYDKKVIYLDQPLEAEPCVNPNIEQKILEVLIAINDKLILREHPNKICISNGFKKEEYRIIWELRASEINDSSTLIGYFSTAQMTPFIIYGKIPNLIFMYRLILNKNSKRYKNIDNLIMRFKKSYPGEIIIPESLDELSIAVNRLAN